MRLPPVRFTIRTLIIAIAIGAIPMAFFRPGPRVEVQSNEDAVEVAIALVMRGDSTFRPEQHRAKVYRECGMSPLVVDVYSDGGTSVRHRVWIRGGVIQGPATFPESDQEKSSRDGPGMYLLDRTGKVFALAP